MNRKELTREMTRRSHLTQDQAGGAVAVLFDVIAETVRAGGEVRISDFGTFKQKTKAARKGVAMGRSYSTPATKVIHFKPVSGLTQVAS